MKTEDIIQRAALLMKHGLKVKHTVTGSGATIKLPLKLEDKWIPWYGDAMRPVEPYSRPSVLSKSGHITTADAKDFAWHGSGTNIIAYKPDPYGHLRQALADGKTVQLRLYREWHDTEPVVSSCKFLPEHQYRVKPEPQTRRVPLTKADIPPGTVMRTKTQASLSKWLVIAFVSDSYMSTRPGYKIMFDSMDENIELNFPKDRDANGFPTKWVPFYKEEACKQ